jgi:hypothetical protein
MERDKVKKFSKELEDFLRICGIKYRMSFKIEKIRIGDKQATATFTMRETSESGEMEFSEMENFIANEAAHRYLSFTGNFLGSYWEVNGEVYKVVEYSTRRTKYSVSLEDLEGKRIMCSFNYLRSGTQVHKEVVKKLTKKEFTLDDFYKWVELDPEDDTISKEDEDIWDGVNAFISFDITEDEKLVDRFFEEYSRFEKKKDYRVLTTWLYQTLFVEKNMEKAIEAMKNF